MTNWFQTPTTNKVPNFDKTEKQREEKSESVSVKSPNEKTGILAPEYYKHKKKQQNKTKRKWNP